MYHIIFLYMCNQSYSDGSVLKQSHQSKTGNKYMIWHIDENCFKDWNQSNYSIDEDKETFELTL